ncbi:MAG: hypothetical protein IH587_10770, partial [Anaerolineae bacterium]|nr:hypothetical protein [Anaerolineae bacterium]
MTEPSSETKRVVTLSPRASQPKPRSGLADAWDQLARNRIALISVVFIIGLLLLA